MSVASDKGTREAATDRHSRWSFLSVSFSLPHPHSPRVRPKAARSAGETRGEWRMSGKGRRRDKVRHDNSQRNQGNSRFSPFVVSLLGLSSPVSLLVSLVVQLVIISHPCLPPRGGNRPGAHPLRV